MDKIDKIDEIDKIDRTDTIETIREKRNKFPVSEFFFKNLITLPLHTKITYNQIKHICTKINEFY